MQRCWVVSWKNIKFVSKKERVFKVLILVLFHYEVTWAFCTIFTWELRHHSRFTLTTYIKDMEVYIKIFMEFSDLECNAIIDSVINYLKTFTEVLLVLELRRKRAVDAVGKLTNALADTLNSRWRTHHALYDLLMNLWHTLTWEFAYQCFRSLCQSEENWFRGKAAGDQCHNICQTDVTVAETDGRVQLCVESMSQYAISFDIPVSHVYVTYTCHNCGHRKLEMWRTGRRV